MANVPEKAGRVLNMVLLAFLLIGIRVWYLAVVKHEEHATLARRPQQRVSIESPNRGTIRDRFNLPLAVNQIQYNASVCYEGISHLPRVRWVKGEDGKRTKVYVRREYIARLSEHLGKELDVDPVYIEDLIWSKAAIFPNTPFNIRENVSEEEYYRLHMMERDWPGLVMETSSRRHYPYGKVGCNLLGYMGAISSREHLSIRSELRELDSYLTDRSQGLPVVLPKGYVSSQEVRRRYQELKDRSYTINSRIGKGGIEGRFDDQLRGISGKTKREVDNQGNILRTLPESYPATPGRRFLLTISAELQKFAEELLIRNESLRIEKFPTAGKKHTLVSPPWIKGGAIVAVHPKSGEVLAMASYPRFSPEDFSHPDSRHNVSKWLESTSYIGSIWDGRAPLERELLLEGFPSKQNPPPETVHLTWDVYLDMILSRKSQVRKAMSKIANLHNAIYLQNSIETLYQLSEVKCLHHLMDALFPSEKGHVSTFHKTPLLQRKEILERLNQKTSLVGEIVSEISAFLGPIERNDDKILAVDLCRLICPNHLFDDRLLTQTGEESLSAYRTFNQTVVSLQKLLKERVRSIYHDHDFAKWREEFFTSYLKEKRNEERERNSYQRPYLDYLTEIEERLFGTFFDAHKWDFLACYLLDDAPLSEAADMAPYYRALIEEGMKSKDDEAQLLKHHLSQMDFPLVIAYLKTMREFDELNRSLYGRYYFTFRSGKTATEKDLARAFYPFPGYGYARSFAFQETIPLGSIFKVVTAYEGVRQHYDNASCSPGFSMNPLTIIDQSPPYNQKMTKDTVLGYRMSGVPITRQYKGGRVPRGHLNIGRIDCKNALVRSSNVYFALLSSDILSKPSDLSRAARDFGFGSKTGLDLPGEMRGIVPDDLDRNQSGLYAFCIGQHTLTVTPIQTAMFMASLANGGDLLKPQLVHTIANLEPADELQHLFKQQSFAYQELLKNVGIRFPIFTEGQEGEKLPYVWRCAPTVRTKLEMPKEVHNYLMESIYEVINSDRGTGRPGVIRSLWNDPLMRRTYYNMRSYLAGKTSTAEIAYRPCIDRQFNPILCKHIWFGGMSLKKKEAYDDADLVVIVCLRYGDLGKEAAPLAAEIASKWREICKERGIESTKL